MKTSTIEATINSLNIHRPRDSSINSLSPTVDFFTDTVIVQAYNEGVAGRKVLQQTHFFYMIKNESGAYVGAVYLMMEDMHWVILKPYRKKGYLINAMQETIIPHLFLESDIIRISINLNDIGNKNYLASKGLADKLGFRFTRHDDAGDCDWFELKKAV